MPPSFITQPILQFPAQIRPTPLSKNRPGLLQGPAFYSNSEGSAAAPATNRSSLQLTPLLRRNHLALAPLTPHRRRLLRSADGLEIGHTALMLDGVFQVKDGYFDGLPAHSHAGPLLQ